MFTQKIFLALITVTLIVSCTENNGSATYDEWDLEKLHWEFEVKERGNTDTNIKNRFEYAETVVQILDRDITLRIKCLEGRKLLLQIEGELLRDVAVPNFIESRGVWSNQINGVLINPNQPVGSRTLWNLNFSQESSNENLFSTIYDAEYAQVTLFSPNYSVHIQLVGNHFLKGSLKKLSNFFEKC
jgi:hypothetical protein